MQYLKEWLTEILLKKEEYYYKKAVPMQIQQILQHIINERTQPSIFLRKKISLKVCDLIKCQLAVKLREKQNQSTNTVAEIDSDEQGQFHKTFYGTKGPPTGRIFSRVRPFYE
jgi:hypothetical protein